MGVEPGEILDFWFGDVSTSPEEVGPRAARWFRPSAELDGEIERRFAPLPDRAAGAELDAWRREASSTLPLVLVLDQFPRNLYRGSARAFAFDPLACEVALEAISKGFDEALDPLQASFLYFPLEHAEDLERQERCVKLFEELVARAPTGLLPRLEQFLAYAERHRDVIRRFGRFPHRNALLGRQPTSEEVSYLESGGDAFG